MAYVDKLDFDFYALINH